MPALIKVYPTKASALAIPAIPGRPKLTVAGAMWPQDSFTMRRLTDGSVTTDASLGYQPAAAAPAPAPAAPFPSATAAPAPAVSAPAAASTAPAVASVSAAAASASAPAAAS